MSNLYLAYVILSWISLGGLVFSVTTTTLGFLVDTLGQRRWWRRLAILGAILWAGALIPSLFLNSKLEKNCSQQCQAQEYTDGKLQDSNRCRCWNEIPAEGQHVE